ncbi:MAG: bifunctional glutamate N-acetyltransferase/amino-acid acetyltransferase ArgJ [Alphaproteobacteria bacterium]|nr:MAG: bifunctional glutamate N-acetyltransferase/amino-acid acetyltransferase ArgJ [Alphaproteobacteria bacterium]
MPLSPLAPASIPDLPAIAGVRLAVACAGVKYRDRADVLLALLDPGTVVAGVLTRSKTASSEVEWCRKVLTGAHQPAQGRALCVVAGNSNAFTGKAGKEAVAQTVSRLAALGDCALHEVLVASTGVIGVPMPADKVAAVLDDLVRSAGLADYLQAAQAIMTTDTFPKLATRTASMNGRSVRLNGIVKGSGMIAPDMATMLGFIFTDATIAQPVLQALLVAACDKSFHCITVDGDTSTSDTVLAFATGHVPGPAVDGADDPRLDSFKAALEDLCIEMAQLVVRDGEGASKFIEITVTGAESDRAARRIGMSIANSPLVKTAIAGEDANWGRVVMAVGKAGEAADRDRLAIHFGDTLVAEKGAVVPDYDEAPVAAHLRGRQIRIGVDLGLGTGAATVWTCDLTHGYITINADYRS